VKHRCGKGIKDLTCESEEYWHGEGDQVGWYVGYQAWCDLSSGRWVLPPSEGRLGVCLD